jgi:hypothetical protein
MSSRWFERGTAAGIILVCLSVALWRARNRRYCDRVCPLGHCVCVETCPTAR